jgi:hypothetical protein
VKLATMFDSCAVVKHLDREASHYDSCARLTVWSVKLAKMIDSCAVVKHLERETSHYV